MVLPWRISRREHTSTIPKQQAIVVVEVILRTTVLRKSPITGDIQTRESRRKLLIDTVREGVYRTKDRLLEGEVYSCKGRLVIQVV